MFDVRTSFNFFFTFSLDSPVEFSFLITCSLVCARDSVSGLISTSSSAALDSSSLLFSFESVSNLFSDSASNCVQCLRFFLRPGPLLTASAESEVTDVEIENVVDANGGRPGFLCFFTKL